tara:strand:- start:190 stop:462 length:273 start_codon:yes stop_codon:yes gene_type:complete
MFHQPTVSDTKRMMEEKIEKERGILETIGKLLQLKYRINETAKTEGNWSTDMSDHKSWVQTLINDVRKNNLTKIAREDMQLCNSMWKLYD